MTGNRRSGVIPQRCGEGHLAPRCLRLSRSGELVSRVSSRDWERDQRRLARGPTNSERIRRVVNGMTMSIKKNGRTNAAIKARTELRDKPQLVSLRNGSVDFVTMARPGIPRGYLSRPTRCFGPNDAESGARSDRRCDFSVLSPCSPSGKTLHLAGNTFPAFWGAA